jgi:hypothetical protein
MFKIIWPLSGNVLYIDGAPARFATAEEAQEYMRQGYPAGIEYVVREVKGK